LNKISISRIYAVGKGRLEVAKELLAMGTKPEIERVDKGDLDFFEWLVSINFNFKEKSMHWLAKEITPSFDLFALQRLVSIWDRGMTNLSFFIKITRIQFNLAFIESVWI
jgi:hypothetical protein